MDVWYGSASEKKGLHLNQIHQLDRSFEEMMLGLESWIPMYMTGQISPYYLKGEQSNVFHHFLKVSGAAVLSGEAITGHHSEGRYYLSKTKRRYCLLYKACRSIAAKCFSSDGYLSRRSRRKTECFSACRHFHTRKTPQHSFFPATLHAGF